jgi:agmatinase
LTPHQVLSILRSLGGVTFVGMDVVEVAPAYDNSEVTAINAATIVHDYLCLIAQRQPETR